MKCEGGYGVWGVDDEGGCGVWMVMCVWGLDGDVCVGFGW